MERNLHFRINDIMQGDQIEFTAHELSIVKMAFQLDHLVIEQQPGGSFAVELKPQYLWSNSELKPNK